MKELSHLDVTNAEQKINVKVTLSQVSVTARGALKRVCGKMSHHVRRTLTNVKTKNQHRERVFVQNFEGFEALL